MRNRASRSIDSAALAFGLSIPALLGSIQASAQDDLPSAREIEQAGALFRSGCTTCHLPPDPDRRTDLAWLRQVTDTA